MPDIFPQTLRTQRKQQHLSVQALANATGLAKSFIDYLEQGKRSPSMQTIKTLSDALRLDCMVLFNAYTDDCFEQLNRL